MVIQMINAALLLFAGFLAGNYFSATPVTNTPLPPHAAIAASTQAKEAGIVTITAGRAPASAPAALSNTSTSDPRRSAPVDLAAYLTKFGIADVHEACEFAHNRFLDQTVASHAAFVEALVNFKDHKKYLSALGKRLAEDEKFWIGRGDLDLDSGKARIEVIMDSHAFLPDAEADDKTSCFRARIRVDFANGRNFSTAVDACTDSLVTKNRNYYLNWESFEDLEIGRNLAVVQIPLPESTGAELEFMRSSGQTWSVGQGFHWNAVPLDQGLRLIDQI